MRFRELRIEASKRISDHGIIEPGYSFRSTTHHVREIFTALLPSSYVLDGSSVFQITCGPRGEESQYRQCLGSSEYYVEDFEFSSYAKADPAGRERMILATVERALSDIATRANADSSVVKTTAAAVLEHNFQLTTEIKKLRKGLGTSGNKLQVYRSLASEFGEAWYARITDRHGSLLAEREMNKKPDSLDRRDYFKAAELIEGSYVVRDHLGKETFRLDVSRFVGG